MVRVPQVGGGNIQPIAFVPADAPTVRPMQDVAGEEAQQTGQALQALGQGLTATGTVLQRQQERERQAQERERAARMQQAAQDRDDLTKAEAQQGYIAYRNRVHDLLYNDQTGFLQQTGSNAYGMAKMSVLDARAKMREEALQGLGSEDAKLLFSNKADAFDYETLVQIDGHSAAQRRAFVKTQQNAYISAEIEDLGRGYGTGDWDARMAAVEDSIRSAGLQSGEPEDVVAKSIVAARHQVYSQVVDNTAASGDSQAALEQLREFDKKGFVPTKYALDKERVLQQAVDKSTAETQAALAWQETNGRLYEAGTKIRNDQTLSSAQKKLALEALQEFHKDQDEVRTAAANAATRDAEAYAVRNNIDRADQLPQEMTAALNAAGRLDEFQAFLDDNKQRFSTKESLQNVQTYLAQADTGDVPALSAVQFEKKYRRVLSAGDYARYEALNNKLLTGTSAQRSASGTRDEDDLLNVDLQIRMQQDKLLFGSRNWKAQGGIFAKQFQPGMTKDAAPDVAYKVMRFRQHFDPIYQQLLRRGLPPAKAFDDAYKSVFQMPKTADGRYEWELSIGEIPGTMFKGGDDSPDIDPSKLSDMEVSLATKEWSQNNPSALRAPSAGELVQYVVQQRRQRSAAAAARREQQPGWVSWQTLGLMLDISADEAKGLVYGNESDRTGVFYDQLFPVRRSDLVVVAEPGPFSDGGIEYASDDVEASEIAEAAQGISLASAELLEALIKRNVTPDLLEDMNGLRRLVMASPDSPFGPQPTLAQRLDQSFEQFANEALVYGDSDELVARLVPQAAPATPEALQDYRNEMRNQLLDLSRQMDSRMAYGVVWADQKLRALDKASRKLSEAWQERLASMPVPSTSAIDARVFEDPEVKAAYDLARNDAALVAPQSLSDRALVYADNVVKTLGEWYRHEAEPTALRLRQQLQASYAVLDAQAALARDVQYGPQLRPLSDRSDAIQMAMQQLEYGNLEPAFQLVEETQEDLREIEKLLQSKQHRQRLEEMDQRRARREREEALDQSWADTLQESRDSLQGRERQQRAEQQRGRLEQVDKRIDRRARELRFDQMIDMQNTKADAVNRARVEAQKRGDMKFPTFRRQ